MLVHSIDISPEYPLCKKNEMKINNVEVVIYIYIHRNISNKVQYIFLPVLSHWMQYDTKSTVKFGGCSPIASFGYGITLFSLNNSRLLVKSLK